MEIIYPLSVVLYFIALWIITTYGYRNKQIGVYSSQTERVPLPRMSQMPIPQLTLLALVGFLPILNSLVIIVAYIIIAVYGFGPSLADIGEWFSERRIKKDE